MNIVITGVTGFRNRGVEALVRPTVLQLLGRYPEAQITVVTWSPDYDARRFSHPQVTYVEDAYLKCGHWVLPPVPPPVHRSLWMRATGKAARTLNILSYPPPHTVPPVDMPFVGPDLVIVSGGDLYSSDYGTNSLQHFLRPVEWSCDRGIPCALIGQSVGKFKCAEDVALWKKAEAEAALITLREPLSFGYLTDELGCAGDRLVVTADTAFLLEPDAAIASQQPIFATGPTVALSISGSICKWTGNDYERHIEVWVQLIRTMLDQWGANVAIIPHVQEDFSDDRILSTQIFRQLGCDRRVRVFAEDLTAAEFKGIISKCEMVVAERMHAAIAGFSCGICTVPIGYSIKADGITTAVLSASGIDAEELVLSLPDLLDLPHASSKLNAIWNDRARYQDAIRVGSVHMRIEAMRNFDLIEELLPAC